MVGVIYFQAPDAAIIVVAVGSVHNVVGAGASIARGVLLHLIVQLHSG
jgi:hypothetical protein